MTDNETETVAVPVETLRQWQRGTYAKKMDWINKSIDSFIPKPKPRLVAVSREQWRGLVGADWFDAQPDLLATLDGVIDQRATVFVRKDHRSELKAAIRKALGVES